MLTYERFVFSYLTKRQNDLTKVHFFDNHFELPIQSTFHTLDILNDTKEELSVFPDVENSLFFSSENKYFFYNVTTPENGKLSIPNTGIRLITNGVDRELTRVKSKYSSNIRFVNDLNNLPNKRDHLDVINYNPLFRTRITGQYPKIKLFDFLFSQIINNCIKLDDRQHFIHIPIVPDTYEVNDFIRSLKGIKKANLKYTENMYYLFLIHLYNYLHVDSDIGLFNKVPFKNRTNINFILTKGKYSIIYNLKQLDDLNDKNKNLLKFISHWNMLSDSGIASDVKPIDQNILSIKDTNPESLEGNRPSVKNALDFKGEKELNKSKIEVLDQSGKEAIYTTENLSPAQKERALKLSQKYKEIKLGDQTLSEIILDDVPQTINKKDVSHLDSLNIPDKDLCKSSVTNFDNEYMTKTIKKDIVNCCTAFTSKGLFVTNIKEEFENNSVSKIKHYTVTFTDVKGGTHTVKFSFPHPDENGKCLINGSIKMIKKQMVSLPICKVSPKRVTLNSNFNKSLVERNTNVANDFYSYIRKFLTKIDTEVKVKYNSRQYDDLMLPYEYSALGTKITTIDFIKNKKVNFFFDYKNRFNNIPDSKPYVQLEKDHGVYFGKDKDNDFFIDVSGTVSVFNRFKKEVIDTSTIIDVFDNLTDTKMTPQNSYTDLKILNKKLPVIFVLCYKFGLSHMLKYLNADYKVYPTRTKIDSKVSDIKIKFKDQTLVISRTPLVNSLLFAGLNWFKLSEYYMEELDSIDVYYDLIVKKGLTAGYLKGIDNMYDLFIDPITYDVLVQMGEPTTFKDLLIRATFMLTTMDHKEPNSMTNFRVRSYEKMTAALYNEVSRELAQWENNGLSNKSKFSINPQAVYRRVVQDELMVNVETVNPIHDLKLQSSFSYAGMGGRTSDTFMVADRKFPDDGVGIISEATVDSGNVAINAQLSMDAKLLNTRGLVEPTGDIDKLSNANILSATGLFMPSITNDNGMRTNLANGQISQYVPTQKGTPSRMRTGYEKVLPHMLDLPFAKSAKLDGKVVELNEDLKMVKIKYNDGSTESIHYGEDYSKHGGGGFYVTQNLVCNFKLGEKVTKDDILVYNDQYFQSDPYSKQVDCKLGILSNVALVEVNGTLEDSGVVTDALAEDLGFSPTHVRTIALTRDSVLHEAVKVGTKVFNTDKIMIFESGENSEVLDSYGDKMDEETLSLLSDLNRDTPKAKYTGTVVKIDCFYKCETHQMSKSLGTFVKANNKIKNQKAKFASDSKNKDKYMGAEPLKTINKFASYDLDEDTVIVQIYIREDVHKCSSGNKMVFDSSLKSIVSKTIAEPIEVEDGSIKVDALTSARGVNARVIMSPFITGIVNRCMEKLEQDIIEIYEG